MNLRPLHFFFGILFSLVVTTSAFAGTGFVESPLWLYPESPKEGETVTLSALFRNSEKYTLSGTVLFYDGDVLLDEEVIRIAPGGVATASTSFRIGAGSHDFRASVGGLSELSTTGKVVPLALPLESATMRKLVVTKETPISKLTAQVKSASDTSTDTDSGNSPVLAQVGVFEDAIVSVIPEPIKETTSRVTENVEAWREEQVGVFSASRDEAKRDSQEHSMKVAASKVKK